MGRWGLHAGSALQSVSLPPRSPGSCLPTANLPKDLLHSLLPWLLMRMLLGIALEWYLPPCYLESSNRAPRQLSHLWFHCSWLSQCQFQGSIAKLSMSYFNITSFPMQESPGDVWATEFKEKVHQRWSCMRKSFYHCSPKDCLLCHGIENAWMISWLSSRRELWELRWLPLLFMQNMTVEWLWRSWFSNNTKTECLLWVLSCIKCFVHVKAHLLSHRFYHLDVCHLSLP